MARSVADAVLDAALTHITSNGTRIDVCATEPTTYTAATSTNSLGNTTISGADYTGPADGDVSGRKITVGAQSGITVGTSGTADHLAITDGAANLLYVTVVTSQSVTSGNTMDTSAFDIEIEDPTAP